MSAGNKKYTDTEIMFGALDRIVREEMKKRPSKRDEALIDECIAEMAKLKGVRAGYTEEEIGAIVEKLEARAAASKKTPERPRRVRRVTAAVCAACLIMVGSIACVAWNPFCVVKEWMIETLQLPVGDVIESQEITYSRQGETEKYNTVEELIERENLGICYPSVLPDNVYIQSVEVITFNNSDCIKIYFNNSDYEFTVQKDTFFYLYLSEYDAVDIDGITYYIDYQHGKFVAQASINSDVYYIQCQDYQDVLLMINNMKKEN